MHREAASGLKRHETEALKTRTKGMAKVVTEAQALTNQQTKIC